MSVIVSKTFTTTCNGALLEDINNDVNIGPLCEQIVNDGTSSTHFYFASALSGPEETVLNNKLAVWVCPELPEVVTEDQIFDDGEPAGPDVIWSSEQITNNFAQTAFKTIAVSGQSDVVADSNQDTLTLVAGTGIDINTDAGADTITITATDISGADMAGVSLTRSASYTIPATYTNIEWTVTSIQTDTSIVEHSQTNRQRILIKESGVYLIAYSLSVDADAGVGVIDVRMLINDTTLIPASTRQISEDDETNDIGNVFLASLTAGQYITIQIQTTPTGDVLIAESTITVVRMRGTKGDKGDQGDPGTGTVTSVAATGSTGLTVGGSPITTSGTLTLTLDTGLQNLASFASTGFIAATANDQWAARTITGAPSHIVVSNGNGVSGDPSLSLANVGVAGTYANVTTDAYGRVTSGSVTQTVATGGTGLGSLGTANQVLGVNNGATALEYKTLTAGSGISITHAANSVTIANSGLSFVNFAVSGQSTVVADATNDTLTLVAGTGMTITTNATTDTITFTATNTGTVTSVAATQPAAGLTISGSPITTSGTLTFALANDLAGVEGLATTGIATRTAADTWTTRTITGTTGNITVTNGDGVGGNPTLNLATAGTAGTYATVTTDTFGRVTSGSATQSTTTGGTGLSTIGSANQVLGVNAAGAALEYKTLTAGSGISITHAANSVTIANTLAQTIIVQDEGTPLAGGPFTTLNFVGATVAATPAGTGVAQITVSGGSGAPAAPTTSIQFNNSGAFGGTARNVWDNTNNIQTISGAVSQNRLTLYDGAGTVDTTQRANAALYIQVDGDATYEGIRTYFKRSAAGISGWIAYHYDQNTPNIRLTDEDDDAPYIAFNTISTGTYDDPLHVSVFGARGTYGSRDNIGDNPGFAWFIGNNTNPAALITAYQPVMELDSQWLRIPTGTTLQRPSPAVNGMIRYNTTTSKLEGYEGGGWADLVQSSGGGAFGENFQQASNDAESSTTSNTFQQKLRMTTPSLPSGTYRIGYSVEARCNSTAASIAIQVQINDTTTIGESLMESQDVANYDDFNGFYYYTGSGVLNIDIDYRSSSGGTTSYTRRARLEIWRVS